VPGDQGHGDEYGTMAQLDGSKRRASGLCELLKLTDCGHAPFRDQPEKTLSAVSAFLDRLKSMRRNDPLVISLVASATRPATFMQLVLPPLFPLMREELGVTYATLGHGGGVF